eukprot:1187197-Prorocentrum_minimum.AAC.6
MKKLGMHEDAVQLIRKRLHLEAKHGNMLPPPPTIKDALEEYFFFHTGTDVENRVQREEDKAPTSLYAHMKSTKMKTTKMKATTHNQLQSVSCSPKVVKLKTPRRFQEDTKKTPR